MILPKSQVEDAEVVEVELRVHLAALLVHGVLLGKVIVFALGQARFVVEGLRGRVLVVLVRLSRITVLSGVLVMVKKQLDGFVVFATV